ncbi:hypothetical protein [Poseidonibacter lekithochrous]|uniref:hypothetical protein n=1 Tax=Poseidonibacter lekithochrous TaxID=1904463 RepID=UPI0008FCD77A|nr:hypothetical protein [Poseidonibacter lekithochrous]QKJ22318.1 hypothetical protein ALEK_1038 [Poseidonibacter lekithochrous]
MKNKYIKLKKILNRFYLYTIKSTDLINNEITYDNVRDAIRSLNKFNLLSKKTSKGYNVLNKKLLDKSVFFNKEYNVSLISSLVYSEDEKTEKILEYIFNEIPQNIYSSVYNKYSRTIDEKFIPLLDSEKYKVFSTIVENNIGSSKHIYEIYNDENSTYEKIVPLRVYILENSWFLCAFNLEKKEIVLIDSLFIATLKFLNLIFEEYISEKQIDEAFNNIIEGNEALELIHYRITPELISYFDQFKLIKDYEIFEDVISFEERLNFIDSSDLTDKNTKVKFNNIVDLCSINPLNSEIEFEDFLPKKYILVVKLSKYKISLIKNIFPNVEVLQSGDINKLSYCKKVM